MTGQINLLEPLTVDGFCGGGGWTVGFEFATGRPVDIGVNHDADAIAMHKANHPYTTHYNESIFDVDPRKATAGRPVKWAHFSPDCTHFSVAKGGTPVKKSIRGLAWVVVRWAGVAKPDIISMENVPEFRSWGPLVAKRDSTTGRVLKRPPSFHKRKQKIVAAPGEIVPYHEQLLVPDKRRSGQTFRAFIQAMQGLGYVCEYRILTASDYGAPTSRRRLFIIFRRDGRPIVWPTPTHGDPKSEAVKNGRLLPWRTAAECIEWDRPCRSIFEREKPLAENTLRRIARGIRKFVVENPEPFIVQVNHSGEQFRGQSINEPFPTLTAKHGFGVVSPHIVQIGQTSAQDRSRSIDEPLSTIVSKAEHCLITPYIMTNNDHNVGSAASDPLHTVTTGNRHFMVAPTIIQYHGEQSAGEVRGQGVNKPLQTIDTRPRYGIAAATLVQTGYGEQKGQAPRALDIQKPLGTVVSSGKHALITAYIDKYFSGGYNGCGSAADTPLGTVTATDHNALVTAFISKYYGSNGTNGDKADAPLPTITGKDRCAVVSAFISRQFNTSTGHLVDAPLGTITGCDKSRLVEVFFQKYGGCGSFEINGERWQIVDITMRMLEPRELYNAQGFPSDYIIDFFIDGKPYPKSKKVARCGNSVPPAFATALVRANAPEMCVVVPIHTMEELERTVAI